jgi:hypothetical protein
MQLQLNRKIQRWIEITAALSRCKVNDFDLIDEPCISELIISARLIANLDSKKTRPSTNKEFKKTE